MKNLLIFVGVLNICFAVSVGAKAQTNVNLEKLNQKTSNKFSLKFIDDIELVPIGTEVMSTEGTVERSTLTQNIAITEQSDINAGKIERCAAWQFKYAMMLDMEVEKLTNYKLYSFIDEWWATRYRYGGSTKSGIDCSAFTGALVNDVYGINLPRTARDQFAVTEKIDKWDLKEGDLVFFNTRGGVSHVGVYLGNNFFVHSSVHDGVTISSLNDNYYNSKFITGGRVTYTVVPPIFTVEEEK